MAGDNHRYRLRIKGAGGVSLAKLWNHGRMRPLGVAAAAVLTVLTVAAAGLLVWYRATRHNWIWQGGPARLSLCGRDYDSGAIHTREQLRADGTRRLYPVFRSVPLIGDQVYAGFSPEHRAALRRRGEPCVGSLYVNESKMTYRVYGLVGGP